MLKPKPGGAPPGLASGLCANPDVYSAREAGEGHVKVQSHEARPSCVTRPTSVTPARGRCAQLHPDGRGRGEEGVAAATQKGGGWVAAATPRAGGCMGVAVAASTAAAGVHTCDALLQLMVCESPAWIVCAWSTSRAVLDAACGAPVLHGPAALGAAYALALCAAARAAPLCSNGPLPLVTGKGTEFSRLLPAGIVRVPRDCPPRGRSMITGACCRDGTTWCAGLLSGGRGRALCGHSHAQNPP